jgi:hypothetical protein
VARTLNFKKWIRVPPPGRQPTVYPCAGYAIRPFPSEEWQIFVLLLTLLRPVSSRWMR